jgi:hypothetical protein
VLHTAERKGRVIHRMCMVVWLVSQPTEVWDLDVRCTILEFRQKVTGDGPVLHSFRDTVYTWSVDSMFKDISLLADGRLRPLLSHCMLATCPVRNDIVRHLKIRGLQSAE